MVDGRQPWRISSLALLLLLLLVARVTGLSQHDEVHKCVHDTHIAQHLREKQDLRKASLQAGFGLLPVEAGRKLADTAPTSIRILPVYQLGTLDAARQAFIKNQLIPAAVRYFSSVLRVKAPPSGPLLLQRTCLKWRIWQSSNGQKLQECLQWDDLNCMAASIDPSYLAAYTTCSGNQPGQCTTTPAGKGAPATDFLLLVSAQNTAACAPPTLAHSAYCYQDPSTDRPVAGNINLCPASLTTSPAAWQRQLAVAIHETMHALGFSDSLFQFFRDETGALRSVVTATNEERGHLVTKLVTPAVVEAARGHFLCPTLAGAELENNGGNGTAGSHWEARIFQGEAMLGVLGQTFVFSNLTLALLQDTGWYNVDFSRSQFLQSGNKAGCTYATGTCSPPSMAAVFQPYYCDGAVLYQSGPNAQGAIEQRPVSQRCTYDHLAVGFCNQCTDNSTCGTDGCTPITGYSNKLCTDPSNANALDTNWGRQYGPSSRCFPQGSEYWVRNNQILTSSGAGCFRRRCDYASNGNATLSVEVGPGKWVVCVDGQEVSLTGVGFTAGKLGPCPIANEFCTYNNCPNDCSGLGACYLGVCTCNPGYAGPDCSQQVCAASSECLNNGTCNTASATCSGSALGLSSCNSTYCPSTSAALVGTPSPVSVPSSLYPLTPGQPSNDTAGDAPPTSPPLVVPTVSAPPPTNRRPAPDKGVVVSSTVRFAGADIGLLANTQARMDFESNFTAELAAAARSAGYSGQLQVVIDSLRNGSILVDSTTALLQAATYTEADALAATLSSKPGSIFGSPYFNSLPGGTVSSSNVAVQAAQSSTDANGDSTSSSKKWLGLSYLVWAIGGGVLLVALLALCILSNCRARSWSKQPREEPMFYPNPSYAARSMPALQREQYSPYGISNPSAQYLPPVPNPLYLSTTQGQADNDGVNRPLYTGATPSWNNSTFPRY